MTIKKASLTGIKSDTGDHDDFITKDNTLVFKGTDQETGASTLGIWIQRYIEVYPSVYGSVSNAPFSYWEVGITLGFLGVWGWSYTSFMDAFPKFRVFLLTSPYRDEVQVPVDPETMEPLPAHE